MRANLAPPLRFAVLSSLLLTLSIASGARAQQLSEHVVERIHYREIGPTRQGGRIVDLAVPDRSKQPYTFYVAAANGGLWKTTNNGHTFAPVFDDQSVIAMGDVTVAPSEPDIVWVGTGEPNNSTTDPYASYWGNGVYKSTDGGASWANMGLGDTHQIGRIVVHPRDPDVVYVAALGHLYSDNAERGVFKTTDGGASWTQVLDIADGDRHVSVVDLVMNPQDPEVLYAAAWDRAATPWMFRQGGPAGGIYKTTDGGVTWARLDGLPEGDIGRIGLTLSPDSPEILYASVLLPGEPDDPEAPVEPERQYENWVYRTDDAGETWRRTHPEPLVGGSYFGQIRVDPNDPEHVYVLSYGNQHSVDGGRTWSLAFRWGGDNHALWIDPSDSRHMLLGYDYGMAITYDSGDNWSHPDELPLAQFYGICVDMAYPYNVYGGTQDFGTWKGPSTKKGRFPIRLEDWEHMLGGDGYFCQVDPTNNRWLYAESQNGSLSKVDMRTGKRKGIQYRDADLRFNFDAPLLISPHNSDVIYHGANVLLRSVFQGESWEIISPDLTTNDPERREVGPLAYGTLTTFDESPVRQGVIWTGSDDGNVQLTRDGGETWKLLNDNIVGNPGYWVSSVEASHHDTGTAYVAYFGRRRDDFRPFLYKTTDFGDTWTEIIDGLPVDEPINVVVEDHRNPDLLFAGSEKAVHVSIDGGAHWTRMQNNMPSIGVHDLVIHSRENDLVVGTHGRGFFIADISALQEITPEVLAQDAYLFDIEPEVQWVMPSQRAVSARNFAGENETYGVVVNYYLREAVPAGVRLRIYDGTRLINELRASAVAGLNRAVWPMTWRQPRDPEGIARWDRRQQFGQRDPQFFDYYDTVDFYGDPDDEVTADGMSMRTRVDDPGPVERDYRYFRVQPGTYRIVLEVGGEQLQAEAEILVDHWFDRR